ncbi:hypothetical protein V492_02195 [Pseudogymnoascus sp. VKM F-4246]|nr:hypothetical protein V492_02195 [Pseudogymnoascus sp. VKM F-4246]
MQAPSITTNVGAAPPIDRGLDNGPGKIFTQSLDENGVYKYAMFAGKRLRWRSDHAPPPETYQETLHQTALQAKKGYVFHAETLQMLGFKVFRTGDYHIVTTLRGKRDVVKFQTKEFLPGGQKWTGPRDIAHLAFLSVEKRELPIYHFWLDPAIFEKNPDQMTLAETIDAETRKQKAEEEAKQKGDGLKMRLMPNITPSDQIWIDKLAEFQKLLVNHGGTDRKQSLLDVMKETFLEDQIRRLQASGEHSQLSMLQMRDQLLYFDNLDNGTFKGVKNNAATKFCMVYFGLPVEPLTLTNIINARRNGDDARDIADRPYKNIPDEVSDLIREQQRIDEELYPQPTRICGGNYNPFRGIDSYNFGFDEPEQDRLQFKELLALRGGAGPSQIPGDNNDDDDPQPDGEHFGGMEDVIMADVGPSEDSNGDCEKDVQSLVPYSGGIAVLPSSLQHSSWIDGFGGGLRGGASLPKSNEEGVEDQNKTSPPEPSTNNGSGGDKENIAPPPPASLPPLPTMESVLATLQKNARQPPNVRQSRAVPSANNGRFDRSQYREYMVETEKALQQDDLRVAAYHKSQSVHEPHAAKPEPPRYGKSVENQLVAGPTTPGIFANTATLAEIQRLKARNGELERLILGRATYCGMCDKSISFTTAEQRDSHFAGHLDGLHSCGFCGISFNSATQAERKAHLASHADVRYTKQAAKTPQQIVAAAQPSRPNPINPIPSQAVQTTGLGNDTILFCQNCSVDLASFTTPAQLIEHARACPRRNIPPSEPAYCKFCGIEIAILGSADDVTNHRNLCKGPAGGQDRQRHLWAAAASSPNGDRELTYWKLCALSGVPDLHYRPRYPDPKPYECRYSGCKADLLQEAKNGTLDAHHKKHTSQGDRLMNICHAEHCNDDLSMYEKQGKERLQRHLTRHLRRECAFPGCTFTFRDEDISPSTHEIELEAKKKWMNHADRHLDDGDDEWSQAVGHISDSDPPSDDDGHIGRQQGGGGNTNAGTRGAGGDTRETQGNIPTVSPASKGPTPKDTAPVGPTPKGPAPEGPTPKGTAPEGPTLKGPAQNGPVPKGPPPKGPPPKGPPPKGPRRPKGPVQREELFMSLPKEWTEAIRKLPQMIYRGSRKKQMSAFICPECYLSIQGAQLCWHRSVCPDGTAGCGIDNDDDFLIFSAMSAGRVRSRKLKYDQVEMQIEGATTWGFTQRIPVVAQYLARNPPQGEKEAPSLLGKAFNTATEDMEKVGKAVRMQQFTSYKTVQDKAEKRGLKLRHIPKRGATTAPPGEPPAKKRTTGTRTTTRTTAEPPAPKKSQGGGGLFVTP